MKRVMTVASIILAGAVAGSAQQAFLHPKLKSKELAIKRVYLMPVMVEIAKTGVKGNEGMGKEAEEATTSFTTSIADALKKAGYEVETPFAEDKIKDNNELKYAVADVQRKYDQVSPQLTKRPKDIQKGRFTLGDTVASVNPKGEAQALVLVRAKGTKQTKGKSFMGGGLIGMAMSGAITYSSQISLVDAKTGDVVFLSAVLSRNAPNEKVLGNVFAKTKGKS